jgi:hypothetical protein
MNTGLVFGRIALLSTLGGFAMFAALHILKPELDPAWHMVSEYALGKHGWAMTLCFLLLALSCLTLVFSLFPLLHTTGGRIGLLLLLCAAAGLALASVFPTDPILVKPGDASRSAGIHALSVMVGVPSLTVAALLVGYAGARKPLWSGNKLLPAFAHLPWISLAVTLAVVAIYLPKNGGFGPTVPVGWPNRFMFLSYFGWLGCLSWPFFRPSGDFE